VDISLDKLPADLAPVSCWDYKPESDLARFYPYVRATPVHGLYSMSLDRFILVDSLDLSAVVQTAQLLSSKLFLVTYVLPEGLPLTNQNCMRWTLKNKLRQSFAHKPPLVVMKPDGKILEDGWPAGDLETHFADQEYALFVWRATLALRLTNMQLNMVDHPFYMKFFPQADTLRAYHDDTKWPVGFVTAIERVLYLSNSVNEALHEFAQLLPPDRLTKSLQSYYEIFYNLLGWWPEIPR
jgi:hypothetical protein